MRIFSCLFLLAATAALAACTTLLNASVPADGYRVERDLAYGPDARQKLDIYVPDAPDARHSVILFIYGGSWQYGSKDDYLFAAQAMASHGFTVVIPDYRLYPQVSFPAFLDDCAAATVWTHAHVAEHGGNPQRLFVAGHSAGAYNAMMLAANPFYLKNAGGDVKMIHASIGIAGPYDFLPLTDPALIALFHAPANGAASISTQPIHFVRAHMPPALLATGDDDDTVMPGNTDRMAARMRELHDDVTVTHYADAGHIGIILSLAQGFRDKTTLDGDIAAFVAAH